MLLLLACARTIPPALQVEDGDTVLNEAEPTDPVGLLAWMVGEDPLVRRPRLPSGDVDPAIAAFKAVAEAAEPKPTKWADLEAAHRGTVAVPLARGARLAVLETSLGDPAEAFAWVLPLPADRATQDQVRPALAWLNGEKEEALLPIVERQVILGWLDGPTIPLDAAAHALSDPAYDRVAATPAGKLLLARAARPSDPASAEKGRAALEEATWIAAMKASADKDTEQAALKAMLAEAGTRAGISGDPTRTLLARAAEALALDAGSDASTGGALLAQAALRWENACPDKPCTGFDRVAAMDAAGRWDPGVTPLADTWKVIAAKEALDHLETAYDEPSFPVALDAEVDVLLGTGGVLDRTVLLYPRPGPPLALALSRAAGGGDLTTKDDLLHVLRKRLSAAARAAAAVAPERVREPLFRIARRAE